MSVIFLSDADLHFPFEGKPYFYLDPGDEVNGIRMYVNGFPCYPHNKTLVEAEFAHAKLSVPMRDNVTCWSHDNEDDGNCNGQALTFYGYEDGKSYHRYGIVLHGRRIPIISSMTRYLVPHEYGHAVHYQAAKVYFPDDKSDTTDKFSKKYAAIRGIQFCDAYGGRKWHLNTGEIIANDIRIILCEREPDFWPHECEHPSRVPAIINFLNEVKQKLAENIK
jgi:hypothetical protein